MLTKNAAIHRIAAFLCIPFLETARLLAAFICRRRAIPMILGIVVDISRLKFTQDLMAQARE